MRGGARPRCIQRYAPLAASKMPEVPHKLLVAAALRRGMSVEDIVVEIACGIAVKGSIDSALAKYAEYLSDVRAHCVGEFDAKPHSEQAAQAAEV
jgi:hypothetical protein